MSEYFEGLDRPVRDSLQDLEHCRALFVFGQVRLQTIIINEIREETKTYMSEAIVVCLVEDATVPEGLP